MYVLYISLIDVHTHCSTCNLSLHKEKFEPASMEHNYFWLMQCIQFWVIFECTSCFVPVYVSVSNGMGTVSTL